MKAARAAARAATADGQVRVFVSYSHKDEAMRAKFSSHLSELKKQGADVWFDGDLHPGDAIDSSIARKLREADVFVALLSPDYLSSAYCQREYNRAMRRRGLGTIKIVGVVVRPCDWKASRAAGFVLLPKDGRPIGQWRSADAAFVDVVAGLRRVVGAVRKLAPTLLETKEAKPQAKRTRKAQVGKRQVPSKPAVRLDRKPAGPRPRK